MIIESIVFAIFICSLGGIFFIVAKKLPLLNSLPQNGSMGIRKHHIISGVETKIKDFFTAIEKQIFLHKFLSWVKIMTLKIETKIDALLHKIRRKAQEVDRGITDKNKDLPV